ncbi:MAG TPA: efflux RND transporter periplasmic adaptor subunit [Vicinamibacteria bacterium]|nr:efflux RND transporter periplasmic adaptor subunit [Vicinamibacteria bacterium]
MSKRMVVMLIGAAVFVGTVGSVKFRQIRTATAQAASFRMPPEAVTTSTARQEEWPATLNAIGSATAVHGVTVTADLSGIVEAITFDSGQTVEAGQVLVRLDTRQEQAQLAAAEAQSELTRLNLERTKGLFDQGIVAKAEFDRATAEEKQAVARVGEIRATMERKQIRAPFTGLLGIRQVNLGQYLQGGDPVVPLQSLRPIYVNFSVPQQRASQLHAGGEVRVTAEGMTGAAFTGRITAVDSVVNEATRNLQVQATLPNTDGRLRPGMFVQTEVALGTKDAVVTLPASAISYAPYGDSVFVVQELKSPQGETYKGVKQQFVKLGGARGDQVAVVSGLENGAEVVSSGAFKLRNGAAVHVDNSVTPANDVAPKPENN